MTLQRRTPMKRTPFQRKRAKIARTDEVTLVNGKPFIWIPEEPLPGYRRNRDDCWRWRAEDYLHAFKWTTWHITDPRRSDAGVPDLWCLRERQMHLELKVRDRDGKPNGMSPAQVAFANAIIKAGGEFHCLLYPDDEDKLLELIR